MAIKCSNPTNNHRCSLKIFVHPVDAVGHYNACVGLAQTLARRGHRIFFLSDSSLAGKFSRYGFDELLLYQDVDSTTKCSDGTNDTVTRLANQLYQCGLFSSQTPLEKAILLREGSTFFEDIYRKCCQFNDQIKQWINRINPDLFIIDNFVIEPAILYSGLPWVTIFSCNPLSRYQSDKLPPSGSGYATSSDPKLWHQFRQVVETMYSGVALEIQNKLFKHFGYPELTRSDLTKTRLWLTNKYLTIYGYPEELDYGDIVPAPKNYIRVDTFCRCESNDIFKFPDKFKQTIKPEDKLIYLSMGSMGAINVELMKRLVGVLANTRHKYIVSKGPLHEQYQLPDNMWGESFLPQTALLPLVDLVITHGGNNTVTESFSFGKPMIVMPLFADQYDNAQRIQEKGFGIRLDPFNFYDQQLIGSVNCLLNDRRLYQKLQLISKRIQHSNSKENAAFVIEQIVNKNKSLEYCHRMIIRNSA